MARGRALYRKMEAVWNVGGTVWFSTYLRRTEVKAKNRACIRLSATGELYVSRGKAWDCISGCAFGFTAPADRHAEVFASLGIAA